MPPFKFAAEKINLTYKSHLDFEIWKKDSLPKFGVTKMWSFVHEVGDEKEHNPTPYEHTHIFVWSQKRIVTENVRFFDIDDYHPNIQNKRGIGWVETIVKKCHKGNKTNKNGQKYFIEPVFLEQNGVEDWKLTHDKLMIAMNAPTLVDACEDLDVAPKSISDIKTLRAEKKRSYDALDEGLTRDMFKKVDPWPTSAETGRIQCIIPSCVS